MMNLTLHCAFLPISEVEPPSVASAAKMDPARFRAASAKLETDPYDLDAWSLVIKEAQAKVVRIVIL